MRSHKGVCFRIRAQGPWQWRVLCDRRGAMRSHSFILGRRKFVLCDRNGCDAIAQSNNWADRMVLSVISSVTYLIFHPFLHHLGSQLVDFEGGFDGNRLEVRFMSVIHDFVEESSINSLNLGIELRNQGLSFDISNGDLIGHLISDLGVLGMYELVARRGFRKCKFSNFLRSGPGAQVCQFRGSCYISMAFDWVLYHQRIMIYLY